MNTAHLKRTLVIAAAVAATISTARAADTGWNQTAAGTYSYSEPANWVDGDINNIWDSSLTLAGAQTITFNADTTLAGATFNYGAKYNLTLRSDGTGDRVLTLSGDISNFTASTDVYVVIGSSTANQKLSINLGGATRTFDIASAGNRYIELRNIITGVNATDGVTKVGAGTLYYNNGVNSTYTGQTTINGGTLWMSSTSRNTNSDFVTNGGTLRFDSSGSGYTSMARTKSLTMNGGTLTGTAHTSTSQNTNDLMGALTIGQGLATVSLSPVSTRHMRMTADSFTRQDGGLALFRGTNLGVNTLASSTVGAANFVFTSAPALTPGTAGTTTAGFIKGAYGDIVNNGNGSGLVTYDADYGVRLLNTSTEYKSTMADGQTDLDNIRIARATGDASQDVNLTQAMTTVGSLSFGITGAGTNSGVTVSGDSGTTLKIGTGTIFARQAVTAASVTDAMTISVPTLDLNGQEGVFVAITAGVSNGNTPAPLQINSSITNDGGKGVTIGGSGQTIFGGSAAHGYTGVTTINSGILRLAKTVTNIGIPGDLVMNGGTLLKNSNAIPDTANVTINAGTFWMDTTTSSGNNNHTETINDFTLNGGSFGNHGNSATLNINGDATINGSTLGMNQGGDINVLGTTTLNGGLLIARESTSTTTYNGLTSLKAVAITNKPAGAYSPITLNGHATNMGAKLTIGGDVTFIGNATNTNATRIAINDTALASQPRIELDGVRTFAIGDGAAAEDLAVYPSIYDSTSAGGIVKTGPGTLALYGANGYTGGTTVSDGVLLVNGSLQGDVTVNGTGSLGGSGTISGATAIAAGGTLSPGNSPGLLTITGDISLADGAKFVFDLGADEASSDRVNVSGFLNLAGQDWDDFTFVAPTTGLQNSYVLFSSSGVVGSLGGNVSGDLNGAQYSLAVVGNDVVLAVPEPGIVGMFTLVSGLLALRRRRTV